MDGFGATGFHDELFGLLESDGKGAGCVREELVELGFPQIPPLGESIVEVSVL